MRYVDHPDHRVSSSIPSRGGTPDFQEGVLQKLLSLHRSVTPVLEDQLNQPKQVRRSPIVQSLERLLIAITDLRKEGPIPAQLSHEVGLGWTR